MEIKTEHKHGSDCTGNDGDINRTLTLSNTGLTSVNGFLVYVSGLSLALTEEYTVSHQTSGTIITFLNPIWNEQNIQINYYQRAITIITQQTIEGDNLFSSSYSVLEDFLKNISGLDPKNRNKGTFIHPSMPSINSLGFNGYPFIVLKIDIGENKMSFDLTSEKIFRITIGIYSDDPTDVDGMADKIEANYQSETALTDYSSRRMEVSPFSYLIDQKGKKISYRNVLLTLRSRK